MADRNRLGRFVKGNQAALKHGGERAVKQLCSGDPLTDEAAEIYHHKLRELGLDLDSLDDIGWMLAVDYARESAAAELYWRAFCEAYDTGDEDGFIRHTDRWGWLFGREGRALERLSKHVGPW